MSVSIKNCPNCRTMLFSDTVQCPACRHILDEEGYAKWAAQGQDVLDSQTVERNCPGCGELVREGLVRCWKCGSFMREEIAEAYREMQSSPQPVIYSSLPSDFTISQPTANAPVVGRESEPSEESDDEYELGARFPVQAKGKAAGKEVPPAEPSADQAADEAQDKAKNDADAQPSESDVPHSVATGGDQLLQVALQEQAEEKKRRRDRRSKRRSGPRSVTGLLVFCPNGHRIEVEEKHRGMTGRCPKCKSPFFVPLPPPSAETKPESEQEQPQQEGIGKYRRWMNDVHIHTLNPEKLKLKAGSLQSEFQQFDLAFAEDELLAASLTKRKGAADAKSKKRLKDREALQETLRQGGGVDKTPVTEQITLTAEQARDIAVVQPARYPHESMFAGIPVFGEGRIAVRLPTGDDPTAAKFASFALSEFREFKRALEELYGVKELGEELDLPLTDTFSEAQCHYSEETLRFLENQEYYEGDPGFDLQLVGRKCQACGLVISEDSRKKEKIGGANGKAIAKAKCPKCGQKFGTISLFTLEEPDAPAPEEDTEDTAAEEPAKKS